MRNTSFSLNDHFQGFIDNLVDGGRYRTASDVMQAGLRLLEEREAAFRELNAELDKGENSGPAFVYTRKDLHKDLDTWEAEAAARHAAPEHA